MTFKAMMIIIYNYIINIIYKSSINKAKNENKIISSIEELERRIEIIKNKNEEHEMNIRKYEHEIKIIDAYNKQFEYKIKLIETKGKIVNDCLSIIKDIMNDVRCFET